MKKIISITMLFTALLFTTSGYTSAAQSLQLLPVYSAASKQENKLWVGTFQLVWNDFMNEVVKGPIKFKGGNPADADLLNKQEFKKSMLSPESYYTAWGKTNLALKKKIEKGIMAKFGEKSDVLDKIDWKDPHNAYLFYAMLKKDFKFKNRFDILKEEPFNASKNNIPYFGINEFSKPYLHENVDVLFYNNPFDYAVALKSYKDEVILYRTNSNKSFDAAYGDVVKKSKKYKGNKKFITGDKLKVPYMSVKQNVEYPELCKKQIEGTNLYIDKTIQTVQFDMTRRGVKLKSEAVIDANFTSMPLEVKDRGRNFFFNKTFVIFMKENNKEVPYFAARVQDMDLYKFSGKVD